MGQPNTCLLGKFNTLIPGFISFHLAVAAILECLATLKYGMQRELN